MKKVIQFEETVEGYDIPVLNEWEIRAAAGILFLATFSSWMVCLLKKICGGQVLILEFISFLSFKDDNDMSILFKSVF